ncbi:MAG: alpha/beta fold hydrolase [Actinomycetales bacterium]|nr:MAG: alpha/beta fold hydrolase [Actinomycetales bacterium]
MAVETAPPGWMQDWSATGSGKNARIGVLLVHGFTGAPPSMRPWGEFLLSKGYTVRVPLLPGHGTKPEELNTVKWQEWPAKVQSELEELLLVCDQVFICGLSMGGGTTLYIAEENNDRLSGIVLVNPMIHIPHVNAPIGYLISRFQKMRTSVGNDIKRPGITEHGYDATPMIGVHQLLLMLKIVRKSLSKITIPVQLFHSVEDHTLPVSNTEIIMAGLGSGNKSRIELVNSYHVATLDYDQELIFQNSLTFIEGLTK